MVATDIRRQNARLSRILKLSPRIRGDDGITMKQGQGGPVRGGRYVRSRGPGVDAAGCARPTGGGRSRVASPEAPTLYRAFAHFCGSIAAGGLAERGGVSVGCLGALRSHFAASTYSVVRGLSFLLARGVLQRLAFRSAASRHAFDHILDFCRNGFCRCVG